MLNDMNTSLRARNIEFTILLSPYEYQLRKKEDQYLLPQKILTTYFQEQGIPYIDAYESLERPVAMAVNTSSTEISRTHQRRDIKWSLIS